MLSHVLLLMMIKQIKLGCLDRVWCAHYSLWEASWSLKSFMMMTFVIFGSLSWTSWKNGSYKIPKSTLYQFITCSLFLEFSLHLQFRKALLFLVAASWLSCIPAYVLFSISASYYTDFYTLFQSQEYPAAAGFIIWTISMEVYFCWYMLQSRNNW